MASIDTKFRPPSTCQLSYADTVRIPSMSQPLTGTPDTMSQSPLESPETTSLSSNIGGIFNAALNSYKKKTKKDLTKHDLFKQLEICDSPAAVLAVFQAEQLDSSRPGSDIRLRRWFIPTANVLYAFSGTLGAGVGLVNINTSISNTTLSCANSLGIFTRTCGFCWLWSSSFGEWVPSLMLTLPFSFLKLVLTLLMSCVLRLQKMLPRAKNFSSTSSDALKVFSCASRLIPTSL